MKLIDVDPLNYFAIKKKGMVLYELGRYDQAIESLNVVVSKNSEDLEGYFLKGKCLEAQGKMDEAFSYYKKAQRENRKSESEESSKE
mmetsp:Transcript_23093/g.20031  ORF Transcript_23093/g.20031 Transcript_23093/m.20031 type:complete len:87 (-) Transcript_23093:77-337(-)